MNISTEGIKQICNAWGLSDCTVKLIKQSENHTYLVQETQEEGDNKSSHKCFILRLTPQDHRSQKAIQAELDYINLIHRSNVPLHLCVPIPLCGSNANEEEFIALVTPYEAEAEKNKEWFAVLFEHAKGSAVLEKWRGLTNDSIIAALGQALARLHQAVSIKGGNPEKWTQMEKDIPQCSETHGGGTNIERIKSRAEAGHEASKILLSIWESKLSPFLTSCGEKHDSVYGVIHGDLNVSNYFAEESTEADRLPTLWIFDFDQAHHNFFGFDIAVVLQMVRFFEEDGLGLGEIEGFNADRFRDTFLTAYRGVFPAMVEAGHMEPHMLMGFELYREFFHAAVAVDILFQAENGKVFENSITAFCEVVVKRFQSKFTE